MSYQWGLELKLVISQIIFSFRSMSYQWGLELDNYHGNNSNCFRSMSYQWGLKRACYISSFLEIDLK